jgi:hypothetical protein
MSRLKIDIDKLDYQKACEMYRDLEDSNPDSIYLLERIKYLRESQPKLKERKILGENDTIH